MSTAEKRTAEDEKENMKKIKTTEREEDLDEEEDEDDEGEEDEEGEEDDDEVSLHTSSY